MVVDRPQIKKENNGSVPLPAVFANAQRWLFWLLVLAMGATAILRQSGKTKPDDFCGRMLIGSEKTHWDNAPWVKDQLLLDISSATRQTCYTFGYTCGYLCEQVAVGALTAGTVKIAQVAVKGGVALAANLAN